MIITNISNAILRNTQNLAKVSIFGGFAYGVYPNHEEWRERARAHLEMGVQSRFIVQSAQRRGRRNEIVREKKKPRRRRRRRFYDATTKTMDRAAARTPEWNLRISSGGE